jgi:hypothetical protein
MQPSRAASQSDLLPDDVLFFVSDIPGGFADGVRRWLEVWHRERHILGPLFARDRAPFAYSDDRFYTAAAAVEAYHREHAPSTRDLPRAEHHDRVDRLREVLDREAPDLTEWATNAATSFNRSPMWKRVAQVIEETGPVAQRLVGDQLEAFAQLVVDARDGHAHALDDETALEEEAGGLYVAARALSWVLRTHYLKDLGLDLSFATERVMQHREFELISERMQSLKRLGESQASLDDEVDGSSG